MVLEIDESLLQKSQMSEFDIRLELAMILFDKQRITLAQASHLAGLSSELFQKMVQKRDIMNSYRTIPNTVWQPLTLNIEKFPTNLSNFAVKQVELSAFNELFEDEPSAEELCKML